MSSSCAPAEASGEQQTAVAPPGHHNQGGRPTGPPKRQSSIPAAGVLTAGAAGAARHRLPMCGECEKSLPNQIVFDKIEWIIRKMQDEHTGLPVKTAKSFMTKIPSVFTGTDLIQWMMRNLKLEDQQEAIHLANLIASHGYIFPIEDHTLSIKNDCTFYRFQTPCLWPSNNLDPENTDYAVYLCKRTMQGKTRLELADYEAENLARLQKMFSRKWEFIFMQAESQAKVDKKRDKLERKVLDSQERAFWDVYRPVPGCVNTTELDIKKACRLSKSAKRCGECQKIAAPQQPADASANPPGAREQAEGKSEKAADASDAQPVEPEAGEPQRDTSAVAPDFQLHPADAPQIEVERGTESEAPACQGGTPSGAQPAPSESNEASDSQRTAASGEQQDAPEPRGESGESASAAESQSDGQTRPARRGDKPAAGHHHHHHHHGHPHGHPHHAHHHHHHHHPHTHSHAHHSHHHHHHHQKQCPHYQKQQQLSQQQQQAKTQAGENAGGTVARPAKCPNEGRCSLRAKQRPSSSTDQLNPAANSSNRRKSECHRLVSTLDAARPAGGQQAAEGERESDKGCKSSVRPAAGGERPSSACCSLACMDPGDKLRSESATEQQAAMSPSPQVHAPAGQLQRKSSLNIARPPSADQVAGLLTAQPDAKSACLRKGSVCSSSGHQRGQLKGAQSICTPTFARQPAGSQELRPVSSSASLRSPGGPAAGGNMGELERELESLRIRLDRGGVKMSKVTQSYLSYFNQWAEYDPFIAQPIPSNPWQSDSTELWDSERQTKDVHFRRVKRWAFSLRELLNDPAGREQFHRFLEKEFSAENLKFWDAVQELKRVPARDVARRVELIWTEFLAQDANCPINIDSKSYETSKRNMAKNKNNRYIFDEAAGHVYQLMKNDSYPRYLRSDMYKDYKEASERRRPNQVAFDVFKPQITTLKHKFNF